jgi:hypothetical protein
MIILASDSAVPLFYGIPFRHDGVKPVSVGMAFGFILLYEVVSLRGCFGVDSLPLLKANFSK